MKPQVSGQVAKQVQNGGIRTKEERDTKTHVLF